MADTVLCFGLFGLLLTLRVLIHYANLELHVRKIAEAAKTPQQRQTKGSYCPELEEVELGYGGVVTHTLSLVQQPMFSFRLSSGMFYVWEGRRRDWHKVMAYVWCLFVDVTTAIRVRLPILSVKRWGIAIRGRRSDSATRG